MSIPQHGSKTNEHYTPDIVVAPARRLLGSIDLDPASCEEANQRVQASKIYTLETDGLAQEWHGSVFLNPPGGRLKRVGERWVPVAAGPGESSMRVWWDKLVVEWLSGRVERAFFVAFTLEILRTSQRSDLPVQFFPRCYPADRLPFRGDQPMHANVLVYLPSRHEVDPLFRLQTEFGDLGMCEGHGTFATAKMQRLASSRPLPTGYQRDGRQGRLDLDGGGDVQAEEATGS